MCPIIEYFCEECGKFEHLHLKMSERLDKCPKCGASLKQLMSVCNSHYVGGGFYKTDYCATKNHKRDKNE